VGLQPFARKQRSLGQAFEPPLPSPGRSTPSNLARAGLVTSLQGTVYRVITRPPSVLSVVIACSDRHDVKSNLAAYALSNSEQRS
jgi:hypothetical protein